MIRLPHLTCMITIVGRASVFSGSTCYPVPATFVFTSCFGLAIGHADDIAITTAVVARITVTIVDVFVNVVAWMVAVILFLFEVALILKCLSLFAPVGVPVGLVLEIFCLNHLCPINRASVSCINKHASTTTEKILRDFMMISCENKSSFVSLL
jgi:hypothetical protein